MSADVEALNEKLRRAGAPSDYVHLSQHLSPLEALVNGPFPSNPYSDILLKYLPEADNGTKEFIARALANKGIKGVSQALAALFYLQKPMTENQLWAVGNSLATIDDKSVYPSILEICRNNKFGLARQMLFKVLAKMKTQEAYGILIDNLNDTTVKGHVIEALGKFGNPEAINLLEQTKVKKGLFEAKAKKMALKRLVKIEEIRKGNQLKIKK